MYTVTGSRQRVVVSHIDTTGSHHYIFLFSLPTVRTTDLYLTS